MSGVNKAIIVGRLGADPAAKQVGQQTVVNMSVATTETWMKEGQKQEKTEWHRIVVWGKIADFCAKYLHKGSQVYVEGRIETRSWEDSQGQKKYTTEIIAQMVQGLGDRNERTGENNTNRQEDVRHQNDDEIPF